METIISCVWFDIIYIFQLGQIMIFCIDIFASFCQKILIYRDNMFSYPQHQGIILTFTFTHFHHFYYHIGVLVIYCDGIYKKNLFWNGIPIPLIISNAVWGGTISSPLFSLFLDHISGLSKYVLYKQIVSTKIIGVLFNLVLVVQHKEIEIIHLGGCSIFWWWDYTLYLS